MTWKKRLLIGSGAFGAVVVAGGGYFWWMQQQPLYEFGSVRVMANLDPPHQAADGFFQVEDDVRLRIESHGEGSPVLMVHGGPGIPFGKPWAGLDRLKKQFKFHYYHQRGCGESTRPFDRFEGNYYQNMVSLESKLGLGAQIADIERIRRVLNVDKLTIIGHSFGGFIATLYAAEFPDRVDKLILVAPAGVLTMPDEGRDLFAMTRTRLDEADHAAYDALVDRYFDFGNIFSESDGELATLHTGVGKFILTAMGYESAEVQEGPDPGGWMVFAMYFSAGRRGDFRPALKEIKARTLIVHGLMTRWRKKAAELTRPSPVQSSSQSSLSAQTSAPGTLSTMIVRSRLARPWLLFLAKNERCTGERRTTCDVVG